MSWRGPGPCLPPCLRPRVHVKYGIIIGSLSEERRRRRRN